MAEYKQHKTQLKKTHKTQLNKKQNTKHSWTKNKYIYIYR